MSVHHSYWANGGRWLLLAAIYCALAVFTLIVVLLGALLWPSDSPYAPISYSSPQPITSSRVVSVGGSFTSSTERCNSSSEPVSLLAGSNYRRIDGPVDVVPYAVASYHVAEPGCITVSYTDRLPPGVTPGEWILEGRVSASQDDQTQVVGWYTESFTVVPAADIEGAEGEP